jgi:peptidoglycan hydrolase CwlO-like protein
MTKVLFILSAVVMLVATFFAYNNGRAFVEVRNTVSSTNVKVQAELNAARKSVDQVSQIAGQADGVNAELETEKERIKAQKLKIAQSDNDTKRTQEELDDRNSKLAELKVKLEKLPQGVKTETLVEDMNKIKKAIADLQVSAEEKKKEVDAEESQVAETRKGLDDLVRKIEERKKGFDRNSLSAQVVAVNSDWGFVIVNAGQSKGITEATKLLVTRGTQTVGKLSIVSVQGDRTVANILPDTLAEGMTIAPGDRVILEKLYQ